MKKLYRSPSNAVKFCCTVVMLTFSSMLYGQTLNANWKHDLDQSLEEFLNCQANGTDNNQCNKFLGESLNTVYKVNDFYASKLGRYMRATEISNFLKGSDKWTPLGPGYDQKTLITAQDYANAKKAVVAVYMNEEGIGHVVLITPGEVQPSGSWGTNVPNAASFFLSQPDKSFVNKALSFAFGKNLMKDIMIYARNY